MCVPRRAVVSSESGSAFTSERVLGNAILSSERVLGNGGPPDAQMQDSRMEKGEKFPS